ncbi:hypothetical protein JCM1841_002516 [Sporobolomyces salmonicolor]
MSPSRTYGSPPSRPHADFALPDVLSPSVAASLVASDPPASLTALASFLPAPAPALPTSTPAEQRAALGLGLRERAAQGPREFLDEVQRCADEAKAKAEADEDEEDEEGGRRREKQGGGGGGGSSNSMETD